MSTTLSEALKKSGLVEVGPAEVWVVKDSVVIFPEERREGQKSTKHVRRFVLVLSNEWICQSLDCPCVQIAPFSHLNNFRSKAETEIKKTPTNGLEQDSRLALGHSQPLLKTDLQTRTGKLSDSEWETVLKQIYWNFQ
jgi:mRNA-degrading endonuclease toxin of MazEF toxin-antitoxin module